MTVGLAGDSISRKPLRLWLGGVAVSLWLLRFGLPVVAPQAVAVAVFGGLLGALAVVVWWAFFSRVPWPERWGAVVLMIVAELAASRVLHPSIAKGMMGMMFAIYSVPVLGSAFALWAVFSRSLPDGPRRASMAATILLATGVWPLLRTGGVTGQFQAELAWRWSKSSEERLLAQADGPVPALAPTPAAAETDAHWPGFRGPGRDSVIPGIRIDTDWSASPPVELWRRPVGPGWSSFAVRGDLLYTQEQRGADELVTCYNAATGNPVWTHRDAARFWESNAGAGPRATPTLHNGRVYTLGATGILNALDAAGGAVIWSRNAASDTREKVPIWGFAGSPLVVGDTVIAAVSGQLIAYDIATGAPRWTGPAAGASYGSPHLATIGGVAQVLLLNAAGAIGVAPADGKLLWEHKWKGDGILQPALAADGDVLLGSGLTSEPGIRRIAVAPGPTGWTTQARWTSAGLKPYFNDFVIHAGHAFGFDGGILACIDLQDGRRKWKGGRYGYGQLVLLREQGLLLVLSEEGELALVSATPDRFTQLARFPALEGKTWNHPVLTGDRLLVRNGSEMAAFRLSLARR